MSKSKFKNKIDDYYIIVNDVENYSAINVVNKNTKNTVLKMNTEHWDFSEQVDLANKICDFLNKQ